MLLWNLGWSRRLLSRSFPALSQQIPAISPNVLPTPSTSRPSSKGFFACAFACAARTRAASRYLLACVLFVVWAFGARVAGAQETITFEQAVDIALDQNTDLKRAQNNARLASVITTRERMDFAPNLNVSSSGTRSFGRGFSQEEGAIINETSDFFGAEASASVNLFNGFEKVASLRQAYREEDASDLRLTRTREDIVFQVIELFTSLLQNQELAQVRNEELGVQEGLLRQVEALVEVGRRPKSDLFQQQAAFAEAKVALAEVEREVELGNTQLIQVLQLNPLEVYTFEAPSLADSLAVTAPRSYELGRLLETAFNRRTDLSAFEADVAAARYGVQAARSGYWPSLSLSVGYGSDWSSTSLLPIPGTGVDPRTITVTPEGGGEPVTIPVPGSGSDPEFQRPDFLNQLDTRRGGQLRLSLSVPLFDRLQTHANVEQAQLQARNAQYDLQDQQQLVALQVRQAVLDYQNAQTRLDATAERLQAAERAREAARRRYELGAATFVELAQANAVYVSAQSAQVQTRYDVLLAQKLIDYYTGNLDVGAPLSP